ncbi:hypothetical protein [Desulfonatronospira sp.]|uniref:hypothetical protein n=1 Tax=Desulfonatronospira sp. TaxID=1962951 RepID=UPI0025C56A32|nr:hypothetical protein [Desulfonatronospira sp.]
MLILLLIKLDIIGQKPKIGSSGPDVHLKAAEPIYGSKTIIFKKFSATSQDVFAACPDLGAKSDLFF